MEWKQTWMTHDGFTTDPVLSAQLKAMLESRLGSGAERNCIKRGGRVFNIEFVHGDIDLSQYRSFTLDIAADQFLGASFNLERFMPRFADAMPGAINTKFFECLETPKRGQRHTKLTPDKTGSKADAAVLDYRDLLLPGDTVEDLQIIRAEVDDRREVIPASRRRFMRHCSMGPESMAHMPGFFDHFYSPAIMMFRKGDNPKVYLHNLRVQRSMRKGQPSRCSVNLRLEVEKPLFLVEFCTDTPEGWASYEKYLLEREIARVPDSAEPPAPRKARRL